MSEFLEETVDRMPNQYSTPDFWPTTAGADWFINGKRFRETGRERVNEYTERISLQLAAGESPYWGAVESER
ncbi:hypothetical protein [Nocardia niwae]|uniref:hypothetical protein n=1 Tax=Nocardia niwae TaxID=626084 RepID=UPI0007A4EBEF|nr:hypothetical protein [Nocardia niwae]